MSLYDIIAILIALTALFSYINHRWLPLPPSVGVMLIALVASLALIFVGHWSHGLHDQARQFLDNIPFGDALLHWMLGFLLFAGALTVDLNELRRERGVIAGLAIGATICSMFVVAILAHLLLHVVGLPTDWLNCFLLGALISPTDPVAVLSLVTRVGATKRIQTIIAGESLFNDGIGVVLFLTLLNLARHDGSVTPTAVTLLFLRQALGGVILGLLSGLLVYQMLRRVHDYEVEVMLTLALVMATYALAQTLGVSGPIAVVVAGLLIANRGAILDLPRETADDLLKFWALIDEVLNAILFVLIGLQILVMSFSIPLVAAALLAIPAVLAARWLSVIGTVHLLRLGPHERHALDKILIWGGLRGGLAIAMALSLPQSNARDRIVAITYGVVTFSILIQGTTIGRVVRKSLLREVLPTESAESSFLPH